MIFFFDNCLSPRLASTIHGYVSSEGDRAVHIRDAGDLDIGFGRHATDIEWISALGRHSDDWIVFTGDRRISRNRAEREAFRRAGLKGFVVEQGKRGTPVNQQASNLLWRWNELLDVIGKFQPPTLIGIPQNRSSKLSPLQW